MQKHTVNFLIRSLSSAEGGSCAFCKKPAKHTYTVEGNKNWYCLCNGASCLAHFEANDRFIICRDETSKMSVKPLPPIPDESKFNHLAELVAYSNLKLADQPKHKEPVRKQQRA